MTLGDVVLSYAAFCAFEAGMFVVCYAAWLRKEPKR